MNEKRNLGRGLGDMMEEVSGVRAIPSQPAADTEPGTDVPVGSQPLSEAEETRAITSAAETIVVEVGAQLPPMIAEERAADTEIGRKPEPRVVEKIIRMPFMPLWAKLAVAVLAGIIVALIVTLTKFRAEFTRVDGEAKSLNLALQMAQAELAADPLAWVERIQIKGVHVERFGKNARIVFDGPFFTSDIKWSPATDQLLRALLAEIAPRAGECYLTVVGHTARQPQPKGSVYRDNLAMGLRRAEVVMDTMVRDVRWPISRVSARSDGDKYPPYRGDDILTQIRNRTITIEIRAK